MANPILNQKALDGISAIITSEVLSNLQSFINQVTALSKQSKKIQDIINTIADNLDEKTQLSLTNIIKRQNNENTIIKERAERNKLPKCGFTKKNGTNCGKACKSGHKKEDRDICDEHFAQIESYRDEPCAFSGCDEHVKKTAAAVDIHGEIDGVSYVDKFLCVKHHKKIVSQLQKLSNPCKFMVQSKDGERMCGALAVSDERCKKHHGKTAKKTLKEDKPEEKKEKSKKNNKGSKKEDTPAEEEPKKKTKKGSKKEDTPVEEEPKKKTKKGSKKEDTPAEKKSDSDIDVNFKGKRAVNWIIKTDDDDSEEIFVDANSGLVAAEMGENGESNKVVYAIWDVANNTISALTEDAKKYAKKLKLQIQSDDE